MIIIFFMEVINHTFLWTKYMTSFKPVFRRESIQTNLPKEKPTFSRDITLVNPIILYFRGIANTIALQ